MGPDLHNLRKLGLASLLAACVFADAYAGTPAAETCGISELLFADSFEAGALPAPVEFQPSTPLTLAIDSGFDGTTVAGNAITLTGTFSGPPATGVSALGQAGLRAGTRWLIPNVRLQPGLNTFDVVASTLDGTTEELGVAITRNDATAAPALLGVETPSRYAPSQARLRLELASGVTLVRVRVDFDGNGVADLDTTDASVPLVFRYALPGLYLARATIDRATGEIPTQLIATAPILIQHPVETRLTLCSVFGAMRAGLAAEDVGIAALSLHPRLRDDFEPFWTSLGKGLPTVASQLGIIVDGTIGTEGFAEYIIARPVAGQPGEFRAYRIQFDLGDDGVWRIGSM